ncbi:MAG: Asp-tRNA(Asn)/Glu-tRNA(Gln) amidotransferase subunit GatA [Patescibacteria group bacterium]
MNVETLTIKKAREILAKKEISPEELTQAFLKRAHEENPRLNAYLSIFENAPGGIPCAVKDLIMVEGEKCTAGSKILENYVASYDATVVKKLRAQGVSILGKTNLDDSAMGTTGENSAFGPTLNPYDHTRVAGGSSSGSVAVVAAGMALFALGSETGGSARLPASWTGTVGFKPTYGRISRHGLIPMASSLDQVAPITKTVEDAALVMNMIAGHDALDSTTSQLAVPDYSRALDEDIKGLRVAVPKEYFAKGLDSQVEAAIKKAITQLEALGAHVSEVSLPMTDYALATYYIIVPAEVSANLARLDGIRYGYASQGDNLLEVYEKSRSEGFGKEVQRRIMIGTYTLSAGYYDAYYKKAQQVRTLICRDFDRVFKDHDVIVGPTSPVMAPKLGEFKDPLQFYLADVFTVQANLAGLCGISVPCGFGEIDGVKLPIGLQIMGNKFEEAKILQVAHAYESR